MSQTITVTTISKFTARRADKEVCDQFSQPYGIIEVIDSDGDRVAFCTNMDEAKRAAESAVGFTDVQFDEMNVYTEDQE